MIRFEMLIQSIGAVVMAVLLAETTLSDEPASSTLFSRGDKPRYLVFTDMTHDDSQSLIRLLLYANEIDIEGIIVTNQRPDRGPNSREAIDKTNEILAAYGRVVNKLKLHDPAYPDLERLRAITREHSGALTISLHKSDDTFSAYIGDGANKDGLPKSTHATALIKGILQNPDLRPLHIGLWGGGVAFTQALWELRQEISTTEFNQTMNRTLIFDVAAQDATNDYFVNMDRLNQHFLGYGVSSFEGERVLAKRYVCFKNWGYYLGDDYIDRRRIRNAGGSFTSLYGAGGEGDTPSFLYLISSRLGLNEATDFRQTSWSGRFTQMPHIGENVFTEPSTSGATLNRWTAIATCDFYARAERVVKTPEQVNHNPCPVLNQDHSNKVLRFSANRGATVSLSAAGTLDPDGHAVHYNWIEDFSVVNHSGARIVLSGTTEMNASFTMPANRSDEVHIVLAVTDNGPHALQAYRRAIISPTGPWPSSNEGYIAGGLVFGQGKPFDHEGYVANAFDGDTTTSVDLHEDDDTFVGLDIGEEQGKTMIVRAIRFFPRKGLENRMIGGRFQGAHSLVHGEFKDIITINSVAPGWNIVVTENAVPYQYLRYVGPPDGFTNVAEIEFVVSP